MEYKFRYLHLNSISMSSKFVWVPCNYVSMQYAMKDWLLVEMLIFPTLLLVEMLVFLPEISYLSNVWQ